MGQEIDVKTKLRNEITGWDASVQVRNAIRIEAKAIVQHKERELKQAKYNFGQMNKSWVQARKELKRAKQRLSSLDYRKRKYTKEHLGEVLRNLTEGELHG